LAALVAAALATAALATAARADEPTAPAEFQKGRALFTGGVELQGRLYSHLADMPPATVRCANCHALADGPAVPRSLAPRLGHDLLLRPQPRRGGPTSVYDRAGFCQLLRKGLDPALVLISVEMPRYDINDAACRALWRYLTENGHAGNAH